MDLLRAAIILIGRYPARETQLVKNDRGNLTILVEGRYLGWVDLDTGAIEDTVTEHD
jgi:hypothetical protein